MFSEDVPGGKRQLTLAARESCFGVFQRCFEDNNRRREQKRFRCLQPGLLFTARAGLHPAGCPPVPVTDSARKSVTDPNECLVRNTGVGQTKIEILEHLTLVTTKLRQE